MVVVSETILKNARIFGGNAYLAGRPFDDCALKTPVLKTAWQEGHEAMRLAMVAGKPLPAEYQAELERRYP